MPNGINIYQYQQDCKQMLKDSDFTTFSDVTLTEENKAEWVTWRAIVRSQVIEYDENTHIPPKPDEVWIT